MKPLEPTLLENLSLPLREGGVPLWGRCLRAGGTFDRGGRLGGWAFGRPYIVGLSGLGSWELKIARLSR
jgi:hypothetical protein